MINVLYAAQRCFLIIFGALCSEPERHKVNLQGLLILHLILTLPFIRR